MKSEVNRPCSICGEDTSDLVYDFTYPQFGYPGVFCVRRCRGCGLLFNSPRLADGALNALYDSNYYLFLCRYPAEFERIAELHHKAIASVEAMAGDRSLLEVGSAKGYLLALMHARGWRVRGVELSPYAASFARKRFGLDVYCGTIDSYVRDARERFPVIVSTDVIEHVPDLGHFVQSLNRALEPGGTLLIATPNGAAWGLRTFGQRWQGFNPFHIWLLARENLSRLLARHGLEVERAYTYNNLRAATYPERSVLREALRAVLHGTGLLAVARRTRYAMGVALDRSRISLDDCLRRSLAQTAASGAFCDTEDGRSPACTACEGDNLVVVARKVQQA